MSVKQDLHILATQLLELRRFVKKQTQQIISLRTDLTRLESAIEAEDDDSVSSVETILSGNESEDEDEEGEESDEQEVVHTDDEDEEDVEDDAPYIIYCTRNSSTANKGRPKKMWWSYKQEHGRAIGLWKSFQNDAVTYSTATEAKRILENLTAPKGYREPCVGQ